MRLPSELHGLGQVTSVWVNARRILLWSLTKWKETVTIWEGDVRMDLREIGREGVDWMHLFQDRDQWRAM
jgi:hypothetical protein